MGRRWGKTYMAGVYALTVADLGGAVAWVVPTYKNARAPWRFAEALTAPVSGSLRVNRTERVIEFPSGGRLSVYSADNDVALRGEAFDVVVVDEAAMVREETYTDVLLPTLADRDGRIILISTPKGRNWFWREWQRGQAGERGYASFRAPTSANPIPAIQRAAEDAALRVSNRTYRQEWLAEFVDDGGGVFTNVRRLATAGRQERGIDGHAYVLGIDWGRVTDRTVVAVWDATLSACVAVESFAKMDYHRQLERINGIWQRFNRPVLYVEQNSIGGPLLEALSRNGLPVRGFQTTAQSKPVIIDALALAFEQERIQIVADDLLINELEAYEAQTTKSGAITYNAPSGSHDDHVIALAIAHYHAGRASSALGAFS